MHAYAITLLHMTPGLWARNSNTALRCGFDGCKTHGCLPSQILFESYLFSISTEVPFRMPKFRLCVKGAAL